MDTTDKAVRPDWITELALDLIDCFSKDITVADFAALIEQRIAQNPPLLPDAPWTVISHFDHISDVAGERLLGFRCKMPTDAPFMTYEKMEWLRAMLHGRDTRKP